MAHAKGLMMGNEGSDEIGGILHQTYHRHLIRV
jgi:hypothetical protein